MARGHRREVIAAAALFYLVGQLPCTTAWRTWGVLPLDTDLVQYVGKFCFDYSKSGEQAGIFHFRVEGQVDEGELPYTEVQPATPCWGPCDPAGGLYLIVYDDEKAHWRAAHRSWETLTCKERLADASWARRLSPLPSNGILNSSVFVSEELRPRFWYFTFVACGVKSFLTPIEYHIHTQNILKDVEREFGVDEEGSLTLQLLFMVIFIVFSCGLRVTITVPGRSESFRARPLLRLLVLAAVFSAAGCTLAAIHYAFYAMDGMGLPPVEVCSVVIASLSKAFLSVLQLLTAKGWVLFYSPNEIAWRRFTVCTLGSIIIASAACEIHGQYFHDWRTTLYLYESGPGLFILLVNIILFVEASRSMYSTYWNEVSPEIREFYKTVGAAMTMYYLMLPVICLAAGLYSPWVRRKYVARTELVCRFTCMALLAYCLRPSRLDIIINSRLEDGLDSDMCDSGDEMEECFSDDYGDDDNQARASLMKGGMQKVPIDDTE